MKKLNVLDWIALILVIVGGLNWALVGIFNFNLVEYILLLFLLRSSSIIIIARIVYILVGLAAIYLLIIAAKLGKK